MRSKGEERSVARTRVRQQAGEFQPGRGELETRVLEQRAEHLRAEALFPCRAGAIRSLTPAENDAGVAVRSPFDLDRAGILCKGAVLGRIGGKLMHRKAQALRDARIEQNGLARQLRATIVLNTEK